MRWKQRENMLTESETQGYALKVSRLCELREDEDVANINTSRKDQFTQTKRRNEKENICNKGI